jgi:NADH-quinone oxidoreductase subunit L
MLIPLGVLAIGAVLAGMVWRADFFGHADEVGRFFGVPYAEAGAHGADAGHGEAKADDHAAPKDEGHGAAKAEGEHHYVFTGAPGEGAIHQAPGNTVLNDAHEVPKWVKFSPFVVMIIGFLTAFWFYIVNPELPRKLAEVQRPLYLFLLNKWYFDEIYDAIFVRPARLIGAFFWKRGDGDVIDGSINGVAMGVIPMLTRFAGRAQSGYIFTYAFAMVVGIVVLITWMTLTGGAE